MTSVLPDRDGLTPISKNPLFPLTTPGYLYKILVLLNPVLETLKYF